MQLLNAQLNCKFSIQAGQTIALPIALKKKNALEHTNGVERVKQS